MTPIDIVIPYVNGNDPYWLYYYRLYKPNCKPNARFRDTNTLKYQLRSIEKNLPWIRYVHLILSSETQVPDWIDPSYDKLKIVYHKDYIPRKLLPTFNSGVIMMFTHLIPELSDHFILSNDDIIFPVFNYPTRYFIDTHAVNNIKVISENYQLKNNNIFSHIKYNDAKLFNEIVNSHKMIKYADWHLALPHVKSVWDDVWERYGKELAESVKGSKFRTKKNMNSWLFAYVSMYTGRTIHDDIDTKGYFGVGDDTKYEDLDAIIHGKHPCICLNDNTKKNTYWWDTISRMLDGMFPTKSKFEK